MKKLFWLCACLVAVCVSPVLAQATNPEIVVVRVNEYRGKIKMTIVRGPGKTQYVELENGVTEKGLAASGEAYYTQFAKLYQEGYSLQSTFTATIDATTTNTTLLFVKAPKP
jgi:glutathionyl-hydroquinone reductase